MEDVNKQRRDFISLSEVGYVPWNSASEEFAYIRQSKKGGIIAIKTEGTQILFLGDVLVTVASLDLKVPNDVYLEPSRQRRPLWESIRFRFREQS